MPTINLEMMKQLLEEFSEKEALTTEEINVIEKEISNLEQRVGFCRNKLKNLGADKEKLIAMQERYVKGNFSQYIQAASPEIVDRSNIEAVIPRLTPSHPVAGGIKSPNSETINHPDILNNTQQEPVSEEKEKATEQAVVPQTQASSPVNTESNAHESEEETTANNSGSEPIKSINEALKGLFRK